MNNQRLGNDVFHTIPRIERSEWVLKDDLHITAQVAHLAAAAAGIAAQMQQIAAFEKNRAGSRFDEAKNQAPERALARAGFADQAERFPLLDVERDIVDRAHFATRLSAER